MSGGKGFARVQKGICKEGRQPECKEVCKREEKKENSPNRLAARSFAQALALHRHMQERSGMMRMLSVGCAGGLPRLSGGRDPVHGDSSSPRARAEAGPGGLWYLHIMPRHAARSRSQARGGIRVNFPTCLPRGRGDLCSRWGEGCNKCHSDQLKGGLQKTPSKHCFCAPYLCALGTWKTQDAQRRGEGGLAARHGSVSLLCPLPRLAWGRGHPAHPLTLFFLCRGSSGF